MQNDLLDLVPCEVLNQDDTILSTRQRFILHYEAVIQYTEAFTEFVVGGCCTFDDLKQKAVDLTSAFSLSISSRDLSSIRLRYFPVVTCLSLNG